MKEHRVVKVNGVHLSVADQGEGPLVLLLHGFPETKHSWRHQMEPLIRAGYRVIAPDLRGFGESSRPPSVDAYTIAHFVGDIVGLIADSAAGQAVVVGHDWGSSVAWHLATMRPDLVRGVMGVSGPPIPRGEASMVASSRGAFPDGKRFYLDYFQEPGRVDAEFDADARTTLRSMFYALSAENPADDLTERMVVRPGEGMLNRWKDPGHLPEWLTDHDLDVYTRDFETGFTPALNFYRNFDRNWELTAPFEGFRLPMPAMLVVGDRDVVLHMHGVKHLIPELPRSHPYFREPVVIPDCGHWVQQEQPETATRTILEFLTSLKEVQPS